MASTPNNPDDNQLPPLSTLPIFESTTEVVADNWNEDPTHSSMSQLAASSKLQRATPPPARPTENEPDSENPAASLKPDHEAIARVVEQMALVDTALVSLLVEEASEQDNRERQRREQTANTAMAQGRPRPTFTAADESALGAEIAKRVVDNYVNEVTETGGVVPSVTERQALTIAVFDRMYRLGPIQPLVDAPGVENILINGKHANIQHPDGSTTDIPSPFENDADLVDWVQSQANAAHGGGRLFAPVSPGLRLNLPGDVRLSVLNWTTNRPSIAIRIHRHKDITLDRLVDLQVMDPRLKPILAGFARAGISVVISGPMGSGKTTMIRALVDSLPVRTRIGTAEDVRELFLDQLPGREPWVVSAETLEGGGDRHPRTGEREGAYSLNDILYEFVRQQLEIVIVGEVAGREIIPFFKAMQMAKGSMSTTHADHATGAINRLVTCAMEQDVTDAYANRLVAEHVNIIIQLDTEMIEVSEQERISRRYIKSINWLEPREDGSRAQQTLVYRGRPGGEGDFGTFTHELRKRLNAVGVSNADIPENVITGSRETYSPDN